MIKGINYTTDGRLVNVDFPKGKKCIQLQGTNIDKNTTISVIERLLASDFSTYYNDFDIQKGLEYYTGISRAFIEFDNGTITYEKDSVIKRSKTKRNFYCVRSVDSVSIRSFISPVTSESVPNNFGVSLIEYSSVLSKTSWMRLEQLYNSIVGFNAVKIDTKYKTIDFNFENSLGWTEEALKMIYLLVSESYLSSTRGIRVILLSNMDCFDREQFSKLLYGLLRIGNLDTIIFENDFNAGYADLFSISGIAHV